MINKFGANCAACGRSVAPGAGETNKVGTRWVTKHAPVCPPGSAVTAPRASSYQAPRLVDPYYDSDLDGLTGYDYEEAFYCQYGMTQADFRDAVNPDEGDHG